MPKFLEHQDFSESAQYVWAEMKLFSTFIIFLGQNKIPKLPEIFEHPLKKKRKGFSPIFSLNSKFSPYTIRPKLSGRIKIPSLPKKNKFDHTEKHFSGIL
jgi:hypothetical protein